MSVVENMVLKSHLVLAVYFPFTFLSLQPMLSLGVGQCRIPRLSVLMLHQFRTLTCSAIRILLVIEMNLYGTELQLELRIGGQCVCVCIIQEHVKHFLGFSSLKRNFSSKSLIDIIEPLLQLQPQYDRINTNKIMQPLVQPKTFDHF